MGELSGKLAFFTTNQEAGIKRGFLGKYLSSAGFVFSFNIGLLALYLLSFNGCKGRQIIRVTPQMNIESPFWVRVLLANNVKNCQFGVRSSFRVFNEEKGVSEGYFDRFSGVVEISASSGSIAIGRQRFGAGKITILPDSPHVFKFSGDVYRGKLRLEVKPDGQSFSVINIVPLEPYLAGVVGAEMPNYWEPSALESQA
ncbi:MAG: SpoIID/LytB domain-containing protein, partial [Sedimentisphaerales bacterium]|nr:SpoIID/LytB domain-containing protein [Sedimentisphaerales bacterium]